MHFEIKDVTGEVFISDSATRAELVEYMGGEEEMMESLEEMVEMFKDFRSLTKLSIYVDGVTVNLNPDHVVSLKIHGLEEFGLDV